MPIVVYEPKLLLPDEVVVAEATFKSLAAVPPIAATERL